MTLFDDEDEFLPPKPEQVPERLAKKWEARESRETLMVCRHCGKQILASSTVCAYCGGSCQAAGRPVWIIIAAGLLILISILFFLRRWV